MKKHVTFEALVQSYYASPIGPNARNVTSLDELFAQYGKPHHRKHHKYKNDINGAEGLSISADNGEVIASSRRGGSAAEYVVQASVDDGTGAEYIVYRASMSIETTRSMETTRAMEFIPSAIEPVSASQEYQIDLREPLRESPVARDRAPSVTQSYTPLPLQIREAPPAFTPPPEGVSQAATNDDFLADIQSILTGKTAYDPHSHSTKQLDSSKSTPSSQTAAPASNDSQAIFDRIAQSMEYTNKYDLGTVELQNRFADFDKIYDLQSKAAGKTKTATNAAPGTPTVVDGADFIKDLETIRQGPRKADYSSQASTDKWDRIASEVFGSDTYDAFVTNELKSTPFLGQTVPNVHDDTVQMLAAAEMDLVNTQGAGYRAPGVSSTLRKRAGMHGWGMAIDLDVMRNPYVLNEHGEGELDKELIGAYDHIAAFMLGNSASRLRDLKGGRSKFGGGTIGEVYDALREESDAMKRYFSLKDDSAALTTFLVQDWPNRHPGQTAPDLSSVQAQMQDDYEVLGGATSTGAKRATGGKGDRPFAPSSSGGKGDPATGFLNLDRAFVVAMTVAGFAWGAIDIAGEPGDIQHFDLRLKGNGAKVYSLMHKYK